MSSAYAATAKAEYSRRATLKTCQSITSAAIPAALVKEQQDILVLPSVWILVELQAWQESMQSEF